MFSDSYRLENLKMTTQLESGSSCTAEKNTISAVRDFYRDDVNKEQLHSKIQQVLASSHLTHSKCYL